MPTKKNAIDPAKTPIKAKKTASEPVTAQAAAPFSPQLPKISPQLRRKLLIGLGIGVIAIVIVAVETVVAATTELGKGNPFSQLAQYIPTEQVNFLTPLRKSNRQLVEDAFISEFDKEKIKKLNGHETLTTVQFQASGVQTNSKVPFEVRATMSAQVAVPANQQTGKVQINMSGNFNTAGFSVDSGQNGIHLDLLIPQKRVIYGKVHLSNQLKGMLQTFWSAQMSMPGNSTESPLQYLDKQYYVNVDEYTATEKNFQQQELEILRGKPAPVAEVLNIADQQKEQAAADAFVADITPDLEKSLRNDIYKVGNTTTATLLPRQIIAGRPAMVFQLNLQKEGSSELFLQSGLDFLNVIKQHKDAYLKYCESRTPTVISQPSCADQFKAFEDATSNTSGSKLDDIRKSLNENLKNFSLENVKVYVDPVDNSLLKMEFTITVDPSALAKLGPDSFGTFKQMSLSFSKEEISRGNNFAIDLPANATNLTDVLKQNMQKQMDQQKAMMQKYPGMFSTPKQKVILLPTKNAPYTL